MKKKVLIIEDEPIIGEMISIMLEDEGFTIISLADTDWARKQLHAGDINLVLLDLNLPGEGGQSLCGYIKSQTDLKHIPVILVSANMDIEQIKKECGADDLIKKPFDIIEFIGKVHSHTSGATPNTTGIGKYGE